ncbi:hypothetical protein D9619_006587 [Psilocybe cf. subviscida]|uniref:Uncharacterized protein n=1 Tax=Psilocybe cf. subviscida TaxID=2480587 RepID=A0A8H5EXC8_9AGAR|nr:hypothetical protein D9619_006587 [Psilocybe cf. subviscida]
MSQSTVRLTPPSAEQRAPSSSPEELPCNPRVLDEVSVPEIPAGDYEGPSSGSLRLLDPPPYCEARIPEHPVTYTFSSLGPSSSGMVLVPPSSSPDTRPVYHISVGQDPFFPPCSITSIVRGGMPDGPHVGSFRTVHANTKRDAETVCIQITLPDGTIMQSRKIYQWYWFNEERILEWTCAPNFPAASETICTHPDNPKAVLARFVPASQLQRRNRPVEENQLTVTPAGYARFDDILISVLIWERNRKKEFYGVY